MFNYFGPLFLIGNLNGVALVIPPEDLPTRSQIILTLILTLVAFKMTIAQMLPQLPYMTILDKYGWCSWIARTKASADMYLRRCNQVHNLDARTDGGSNAWVSDCVQWRAWSGFRHAEMDELDI